MSDASIDRTCIDAETLAVWADGALLPSDAAVVEAHVSDCARCQEVVAAFALTEPEAVGTATAPAALPTRAPWLQRWWLPIAGGLAAATLLIVTLTYHDNVPPPLLETQTAKVETPMTAPGAALALPPPLQMPAPKPAPAVAPPPPPPQRPAPAPVMAPAQAPRPAAGMVGGVVGGIAGATTSASRTGATDIRAERMITARDAWEITPVAEFASPAASASGGGGGRAVAALSMAAPVTVTRWRVMTPTKVERSTDQGQSWGSVDLGVEPVSIINGSAPSRLACWLVGRAGLILRSDDGITFTRIAFPETIDLIAIHATDALHATVTALGGRTFSTADGGQTWLAIK